jgi:hypothetical protein
MESEQILIHNLVPYQLRRNLLDHLDLKIWIFRQQGTCPLTYLPPAIPRKLQCRLRRKLQSHSTKPNQQYTVHRQCPRMAICYWPVQALSVQHCTTKPAWLSNLHLHGSDIFLLGGMSRRFRRDVSHYLVVCNGDTHDRSQKDTKSGHEINQARSTCDNLQGTMIHPPIRVGKKAALRRLMYLGNKLVRSFETEMTFAETLTPIWAMHQASPQ